MKEATIVYPHQLFRNHPAIAKGRPVYLVEESLILTHNPIHRQKLLFHLDTMDAYEVYLKEAGHDVIRLPITIYPTTETVFNKLKIDNVDTVHIVDTTDDYLERAIRKSGLNRIWYESPLFLLPKAEAVERFLKSKRFMANFYKQLRIDKQILVTNNNQPVGGEWSFDKENRKAIPKSMALPTDIAIKSVSKEDKERLAAIGGESYGNAGRWLPTSHHEAKQYLKDFLSYRFANFGDYEDAIHTDHVRLWHSTLSPLINVGLLTPQEVVDAALKYAEINNTPINALEGFVRQIIGWREFIRASYECDGRTMRRQNFFNHTRPLPRSFWTGETDLLPFDHTISTTLSTGYTHHIERLMVMGNGLLLLGIHPDEVYRWFMGMYVDAYDWVMVPNVYGMSQFADGGSFATKPYISGANYLRKMSNYPKGDWEETWTALYWHFIHTYSDVFLKNYRLSMMPRLLANMSKEKRTHYHNVASDYLDNLD